MKRVKFKHVSGELSLECYAFYVRNFHTIDLAMRWGKLGVALFKIL